MKKILNSITKKLLIRKIQKTEYQEPYIEKDTECDKCYKLNDCINKGYVVNCQICCDTRPHYIKSRDCICVKEVSK